MKFPFVRKPPPTAAAPPASAKAPGSANNRRTTASVFPVRGLTNGAYEMTDRSWVALIHVEGVLFEWLPMAEQDQIIARYQGFLHSLRSAIQIIAITEPINLGAETQYLEALAQAQTHPALTALGQLVGHQLAQTTAQLERIVFLVAVPGPTRVLALQHAESVARGLAMVHSDLQPQLLDRNAIAEVWAHVNQVTLPGSLDQYVWADAEAKPAPAPEGAVS